jgi:hypothetical protein
VSEKPNSSEEKEVKKSSKLRELFDERVKSFYENIGMAHISTKHDATTRPSGKITSEADEIVMKEVEHSEHSQDYFRAPLGPSQVNAVKPTSEPISLEVDLGEAFVDGAEIKSKATDEQRIAGTNLSSTVRRDCECLFLSFSNQNAASICSVCSNQLGLLLSWPWKSLRSCQRLLFLKG